MPNGKYKEAIDKAADGDEALYYDHIKSIKDLSEQCDGRLNCFEYQVAYGKYLEKAAQIMYANKEGVKQLIDSALKRKHIAQTEEYRFNFLRTLAMGITYVDTTVEDDFVEHSGGSLLLALSEMGAYDTLTTIFEMTAEFDALHITDVQELISIALFRQYVLSNKSCIGLTLFYSLAENPEGVRILSEIYNQASSVFSACSHPDGGAEQNVREENLASILVEPVRGFHRDGATAFEMLASNPLGIKLLTNLQSNRYFDDHGEQYQKLFLAKGRLNELMKLVGGADLILAMLVSVKDLMYTIATENVALLISVLDRIPLDVYHNYVDPFNAVLAKVYEIELQRRVEERKEFDMKGARPFSEGGQGLPEEVYKFDTRESGPIKYEVSVASLISDSGSGGQTWLSRMFRFKVLSVSPKELTAVMTTLPSTEENELKRTWFYKGGPEAIVSFFNDRELIEDEGLNHRVLVEQMIEPIDMHNRTMLYCLSEPCKEYEDRPVFHAFLQYTDILSEHAGLFVDGLIFKNEETGLCPLEVLLSYSKGRECLDAWMEKVPHLWMLLLQKSIATMEYFSETREARDCFVKWVPEKHKDHGMLVALDDGEEDGEKLAYKSKLVVEAFSYQKISPSRGSLEYGHCPEKGMVLRAGPTSKVILSYWMGSEAGQEAFLRMLNDSPEVLNYSVKEWVGLWTTPFTCEGPINGFTALNCMASEAGFELFLGIISQFPEVLEHHGHQILAGMSNQVAFEDGSQGNMFSHAVAHERGAEVLHYMFRHYPDLRNKDVLMPKLIDGLTMEHNIGEHTVTAMSMLPVTAPGMGVFSQLMDQRQMLGRKYEVVLTDAALKFTDGAWRLLRALFGIYECHDITYVPIVEMLVGQCTLISKLIRLADTKKMLVIDNFWTVMLHLYCINPHTRTCKPVLELFTENNDVCSVLTKLLPYAPVALSGVREQVLGMLTVATSSEETIEAEFKKLELGETALKIIRDKCASLPVTEVVEGVKRRLSSLRMFSSPGGFDVGGDAENGADRQAVRSWVFEDVDLHSGRSSKRSSKRDSLALEHESPLLNALYVDSSKGRRESVVSGGDECDEQDASAGVGVFDGT